MAPFRFNLRKVSMAVALVLSSNAALAITAEDVMKKMSKDERFSYLSGLIDMFSYQLAIGGSAAKAACVGETYYGSGKDLAWRNLYEALDTFSDKKPEIILTLLAKKACEK